MGKRYATLKQENEELRQALAAKFVAHRITPGTLVVLKADQNKAPGLRGSRYQKSTIGMSFGVGYGCMENLRRLFTELAGGPVGILASSQEEIDAWLLNKDERARLRATLDAIDKGAAKPEYTPLENPLPPPIYTDPSVPGTIGWATAQRGMTPCPGCGLALEERAHSPNCETGDVTENWGDEALDKVFRTE
jgi:hypothetical protein